MTVAMVSSDVELGTLGEDDVLVRIEACGVCHTDLYTASGADPIEILARVAAQIAD